MEKDTEEAKKYEKNESDMKISILNSIGVLFEKMDDVRQRKFMKTLPVNFGLLEKHLNIYTEQIENDQRK